MLDVIYGLFAALMHVYMVSNVGFIDGFCEAHRMHATSTKKISEPEDSQICIFHFLEIECHFGNHNMLRVANIVNGVH